MRSKFAAAALAALTLVFSIAWASPAQAEVQISPLGSCDLDWACPQVTFGDYSNVGWGDSFTVTVNSSGWCTSEINLEDRSGLQIQEVYEPLGTTHIGFQDTSTMGTRGSHSGILTIPDQSSFTYWLRFGTVCDYTNLGGATMIQAFSRTYQIDVGPNPLAAPADIQITPHDSSFMVSWGAVPKANHYYVALNGTTVCDVAATSCTVSDQIFGTMITSLKVTSYNTSYNVPYYRRTTDVPQFRVVEPIAITGGLAGSLKVGSTLTFSPVYVGTVTTTALWWFRCDSPQAAQHTQPNCTRVFNASGASYALTSADLGKYIVPFVTAGNAWSEARYTPGNSMAVVAADAVAPAPPADPDGKPAVNDISNREVSIEGGTSIVLSGTNLGGVTSVTINGVEAKIVSKSDSSVTITVPPSTGKSGLVDLAVTNSVGTAMAPSAISYVTKPTVSYPTKTGSISGFSATGYVLSVTQKLAIKKLVSSVPAYTQISCTGDVVGVKASAAQKSLALKRANATCNYAKTINKSLVVKTVGKQSKTTGTVKRLVEVALNK